MADRTSFGIFAHLFAILAEKPDERAQEIAARIWTLQEEEDYDFDPTDFHRKTLKALALPPKRKK